MSRTAGMTGFSKSQTLQYSAPSTQHNTSKLGRQARSDSKTARANIETLLKGKFKVLYRLGGGGLGSVYLCSHKGFKEPQAVKILKQEYQRDAGILKFFQREGQLLHKLSHPNLVKIFDLDERNGIWYLAMEYIEGESVRELLADNSPSKEYAIEIACQAMSGLAYLHENGISHGDLSPDNIMIKTQTGEPQVKIIDLGAAKLDASSQEQTSTGFMKAAYLAPERWLGRVTDYKPCDIYSMGVIFYEVFFGRPLFNAARYWDYREAHLNQQPLLEVASDKAATTPSMVEDIILQMLAKDPQSRGSAPEISRQLLTYRDKLSASEVYIPDRAPSRASMREPTKPNELQAEYFIQQVLSKPSDDLETSPIVADVNAYIELLDSKNRKSLFGALIPKGEWALWILLLLSCFVTLLTLLRTLVLIL